MAQRSEPNDSLDDFPTPPWATRALIEHVIKPLFPLAAGDRVWEPACNRGSMAAALIEYFGSEVYATDVFDYRWPRMDGTRDFLFPGSQPPEPIAWVITNPPFRLGEAFAIRAMAVATRGVALFVRSVFTESVGRYERLFSEYRPSVVAQFAERVVLHKGRLAPEGSTATAYCWIVWHRDRHDGTRYEWIPPCRKQLERPSDYP